jgi:hypothetical protein
MLFAGPEKYQTFVPGHDLGASALGLHESWHKTLPFKIEHRALHFGAPDKMDEIW